MKRFVVAAGVTTCLLATGLVLVLAPGWWRVAAVAPGAWTALFLDLAWEAGRRDRRSRRPLEGDETDGTSDVGPIEPRTRARVGRVPEAQHSGRVMTWTSPSGRTTVVTPSGELDLATAPRLREQLLSALDGASVRLVMVDMAGVTFIDSIGIGAVVVGARIARARDRKLVVINPTDQLARVMRLTGLQDLMVAGTHTTPIQTVPRLPR